MGYIVIIIMILAILIMSRSKNIEIKKQNTNFNTTQTRTDYKDCYQPKYLLTKNEWYEYKKLKQYAESKDLKVCPKVRLLDIVEPRHGRNDYMSLIGKIQSKHADFVICTQDLRIKAILELDDGSHDKSSRQERDHFVDEVLNSVGYKIIHTRSITENTLDDL